MYHVRHEIENSTRVAFFEDAVQKRIWLAKMKYHFRHPRRLLVRMRVSMMVVMVGVVSVIVRMRLKSQISILESSCKDRHCSYDTTGNIDGEEVALKRW